jgi:hypothetical protein
MIFKKVFLDYSSKNCILYSRGRKKRRFPGGVAAGRLTRPYEGSAADSDYSFIKEGDYDKAAQ